MRNEKVLFHFSVTYVAFINVFSVLHNCQSRNHSVCLWNKTKYIFSCSCFWKITHAPVGRHYIEISIWKKRSFFQFFRLSCTKELYYRAVFKSLSAIDLYNAKFHYHFCCLHAKKLLISNCHYPSWHWHKFEWFLWHHLLLKIVYRLTENGNERQYGYLSTWVYCFPWDGYNTGIIYDWQLSTVNW